MKLIHFLDNKSNTEEYVFKNDNGTFAVNYGLSRQDIFKEYGKIDILLITNTNNLQYVEYVFKNNVSDFIIMVEVDNEEVMNEVFHLIEKYQYSDKIQLLYQGYKAYLTTDDDIYAATVEIPNREFPPLFLIFPTLKIINVINIPNDIIDTAIQYLPKMDLKEYNIIKYANENGERYIDDNFVSKFSNPTIIVSCGDNQEDLPYPDILVCKNRQLPLYRTATSGDMKLSDKKD